MTELEYMVFVIGRIGVPNVFLRTGIDVQINRYEHIVRSRTDTERLDWLSLVIQRQVRALIDAIVNSGAGSRSLIIG